MIRTRDDRKGLIGHFYFLFGVCDLVATGCASPTGCDPVLNVQSGAGKLCFGRGVRARRDLSECAAVGYSCAEYMTCAIGPTVCSRRLFVR